MPNQHPPFTLSPKLVRANRPATITLRPAEGQPPLADGEYELTIYPAERSEGERRTLHARPIEGALRMEHTFPGEQEHALLVRGPGSQGEGAELRLYSLEEDLFARRPYKGDLHMHSVRSDGKEPPAYVAGASRRIGLDFMAVTDHRLYAPSLEAIRAFEDMPVDLRIYPGEEVHPPDCPVHIINFGGRFSLNERFAGESYRAEVQAIQDGLPDPGPGVDRYQYAACLWCFEKIREAGGLGLFCHPYWFWRHRYDVPEALTTRLLDSQPWDALEVIGGYFRHEVESNILQVARYHEERARGRRVPIVGVSDAHGCERGELFGWYYTIVFAPSTELPELIQSIKALYSVAVEALPGETARAHGPFRLVKYAHFLLREVFPEHDALCAQEGRLMLAHLAGDVTAVDQLRPCSGAIARLYARLWGTP
jgi:hypothetical protein